MKFKVGDKIRYIGKGYKSSYGDVTVEGVYKGDGVGGARIWISFEDSGLTDTVTVFDLDDWEKVPEFFRVDRIYSNKNSGNKVKILDTYEVENPSTEPDRVVATGLVTEPTGKQYITVFGGWEFKYYNEVTE